MSKHNQDKSEQLQRDKQQVQQEVNESRQSAETEEIAGRHKNDGQKSHEGADKGPRGQ